ncbi:hypothetical protein SAMN06265222_101662 [Neorhodopirellula lusitana]|uniref:Uncharacterized protein n=1 Tax=Neorhodopirellula lusitana TaxID=445327 RepID=A0ABY1PPW4_9BACT|nr:hypothetical protein [Neorhodopirellula lusitana]SMP41819.1 hypothetical protein SAMN06265222_101662 [Neorhodopirellula lusitana]
MPDTQFRIWMDQLNQAEGDRVAVPEWPRLLHLALRQQLEHETTVDRPYAGQHILIDRTSRNWKDATVAEKRAVYGLYHECLQQHESILKVGNDEYLLLSYEVPNQGNHKGRRADLLGINKDGGLVVFEAKIAGNAYGPVAALLEGLDYLSTLSGSANFARIQEEFPRLIAAIADAGHPISDKFQNANLSAGARCEVIVLATPEYFEQYDSTARGHGWQDLSRLSSIGTHIQFRFARCGVTDSGAYRTDVAWCH